METYNINDLVIGSYAYKHVVWSHGKKRQTIGVNKSVLFKLDTGNYKDIISNSLISVKDILGVKPFIAKDTLLSKGQIIYIFEALEELKFEDDNKILSQDEFTPLDLAVGAIVQAKDKVKKLGSRFKK